MSAPAPVDIITHLRGEREQVYGEPRACHAHIGVAWGALLDHAKYEGGAVPAHLVAAMMAALKLVRGVTAGGAYHEDSFDDAKVYTTFAGEFHPRRGEGAK